MVGIGMEPRAARLVAVALIIRRSPVVDWSEHHHSNHRSDDRSRFGNVETAVRAGVGLLAGGLGLLVISLVVFAANLAPTRQRNEARREIRRLTPDNPFSVKSLSEDGFRGLGGFDPNEQYVRLGVTTTRRIERVSVRMVEVYEIVNGNLLRLADFDPVNLTWSSKETQAVEGRQFLNLSADGSLHIVDIAVCGRASGSRNVRLVAANDNRPPLPAARYKVVILVTSDSPDLGATRLEYGLYRLDRDFIGTSLVLQDWGWIGEALLSGD